MAQQQKQRERKRSKQATANNCALARDKQGKPAKLD